MGEETHDVLWGRNLKMRAAGEFIEGKLLLATVASGVGAGEAGFQFPEVLLSFWSGGGGGEGFWGRISGPEKFEGRKPAFHLLVFERGFPFT